MDPKLLFGSGTRKLQSWIRMRNKSLRIRNTGFITEKRHQKIKKNVNRAKRLVFCLMFFFYMFV